MRYTRAPSANTVTAQYQIVEPASAATPDWVNFPNITGGLDLNPSSVARRDAAGSRIGLIAQDNWPAGGAFPSNGTPAIAHVDYFRVTPDNCPTGPDTTAPTTTATTAAAAPNGANGWFTSDINVTLTGANDDGGSGVDKNEYRVDDGALPPTARRSPSQQPHAHDKDPLDGRERQHRGDQSPDGQDRRGRAGADRHARSGHARRGWHLRRSGHPVAGRDRRRFGRRQDGVPGDHVQPVGALGPAKLISAPAAAWVTYDPANKPQFTAPGSYSIEYRSTDKAGNQEAIKTITFKITATTAGPTTTATLDPATPGAGQTYSGAVTVKFAATDPDAGGQAGANFDVNAFGEEWANGAHPHDGRQDHLELPHQRDPSARRVADSARPAGHRRHGDQRADSSSPVTRPCRRRSPRPARGSSSAACTRERTYDHGRDGGVAAGPAVEAPSGVDYTEYRVRRARAPGPRARAVDGLR